MIIKKILNRAGKWAHSLRHFGQLGRVAANRSFLRKERKKLLMKLGEQTMAWAERHPEASSDVKRLVQQIQKIDSVLAKLDYGGEGGVDFVGEEERGARRGHKKKQVRSGSEE